MSVYMCVGASGMLAVVITVYLLVKLRSFAINRYKAWVETREKALMTVLEAKYGTVQQVISDVVFNPVATYYIAKGATKLELIKDTEGKDALQFEYSDTDGPHTYALLSNGVMHIRIGGQWRLYGDRLDASNMLMSMKPRKQLVDGSHKQRHQQDDNNNQDDTIPVKRVRTWYDNHTTFDKKPKGKMPQGWRWQQVSGGDFAVVKVRDENGD